MLYPAEMSWRIEGEVDVLLSIPHRDGMSVALARLRDDVYRIDPGIGGLMAEMIDLEGNSLLIGCNKQRGSPYGCVGFASKADMGRAGPGSVVARSFALGGEAGAWTLDFFYSHYGCPSAVRARMILPYDAVCEAVLRYLDDAGLPDNLTWVHGLWPIDWMVNAGGEPTVTIPPPGG